MSEAEQGRPGHLVPLAGGWSLWRRFMLRSAGFPASLSRALGGREGPLLAAEAAEHEARFSAAQRATVAALRAARRAKPDPRLAGLCDLVQRGGALPTNELPPSIEAISSRYRAARAEWIEARTRSEARFRAAWLREEHALRQIARRGDVEEALIWQNRSALRSAVRPFLAEDATRTSAKSRSRARLVAKYLGRYSLKNDTIGFFGPVAWGQLDEHEDVLRHRHGPALLAERQVFFEHWGIDALARELGARPELRSWLAPRRPATACVHEGRLYQPFVDPIEIDPATAALLASCDGQATVEALARAHMAADPARYPGAAEVVAAIEALVARGLLVWSLETPQAIPDPERALHARLSAIDDPALRERSLAPLEAMIAARGEAARAAGDPVKLDAALARLEEGFTSSVGQAAQRHGGETYAGRSLIFEECRRDLALSAGRPFIERLEAPLGLLLRSARWTTHAIGAAYRAAFSSTFEQLTAGAPEATVDLLMFQMAVAEHFPVLRGRVGEVPALARPILERLKRTWSELLLTGADVEELRHRSTDLRGPIEAAFDAPGPGWPMARYHCPDLMIAASDEAALRRGDYRIVLGEIHVGVNTLEGGWIYDVNPHREELVRAARDDVREARVVLLSAKAQANRAAMVPFHPDAFHLAIDSTLGPEGAGQVLPIGALVVCRRGDALIVRTRDASQDWDAVAFFESLLGIQHAGSFHILPPAPRTPRVLIDDVVVQRRTWRFRREEVPLKGEWGLARFAAVQTWRARHGIGDEVFVSCDSEMKPFFVDLTSPVSVEMLAGFATHATRFTFSEMLPGRDELWLRDGGGEAYVSELRLIAVDPQPWRAP